MGTPSILSDGIRIEWASAVRNVYQVVAGDLVEGDPAAVRVSINRLKHDLPATANATEALHLRHSLTLFMGSVAHTVHRHYHRAFDATPCQAAPPQQCEHVWMNQTIDLPHLLDAWGHQFADWFESHHTPPAALRARAMLTADFAKPLTTDDLALAVGCSRTTLMRQFTDVFGLSPTDYLVRLRLRAALQRLRDTTVSVEQIAKDVGYQSGNKLYARIRQLTGFKPSEIRQLDAEHLRRVLEEHLSLRRAPRAGRPFARVAG